MYLPNEPRDTAQLVTVVSYVRTLRKREYELKDHLGNVRVTISDLKLGNGSPVYSADIRSYTNHYAFGMVQPDRSWVAGGGYRYGYNGKESDNEIKGTGNALDFGGRSIYDPRLGRFVSIDPSWRDFADMSPYVYAGNNPIYFNDEDGKSPSPYVRLMFYGGARKAGDNSAFYYAAQNVNNDYGGTANIYFAKSAQFIIDKINSQSSGSIQSLDVFTHGSPTAWYMVKNRKTGQPGSTGTTISEDDVESNNLYASKTAKALESWGGGSDQGVINSIDFSKFTNNAVVEVHGCRAADGTGYFVDNMVTNISQELYDAGKTRAVVIGHLARANPNINGDKTTNKEQDYRHGLRGIYHNGELLFSTKIKGRIKQKVIDRYLDKKKKAGSDYDGSKEVYKK